MLTEDTAGTAVQSRPATSVRRAVPQRRPRRNYRILIAGFLIVAAIGYMIYSASQTGSEYYLTASELTAMGDRAMGQTVKLGGRVVDGSIQVEKGSNLVSFTLTDGDQTLPVRYQGVVPDTFQPGADVIVEGKLTTGGLFQASSLLAKCASKYTPK